MPSRAGATLAVLSICSQVLLGEVLLPPLRNVTLLSKDFNLFLTWLPGIHYPPGVFYTVQWMNVYNEWKDFLPCTNISETVCNVTCVSPDLYNSYEVRVKAQAGAISSKWKTWEIDYADHVKLAPPVVQVRKNGDTVVVYSTFSDPWCLKDLFEDLTADLEFWEVGTNSRKKFNMKNTKVFAATVFSGSTYCFSARANLYGMHSNFSEPTCMQLHKEANIWAFAIFPVPFLFILFVCIFRFVYQSKNKSIKVPQALDFHSYNGPLTFLEFPKKELIDVLTFPGHPVILENRSRIPPQICSELIPSVLEEEEEEEIGNSRPYTEIHRFQKNDMSSQEVGLVQKVPDSSSEFESSRVCEGSMTDLRMSGFFGLTKPVFWDMTSGFQGSKTTFLSPHSSSEESSLCQEDCYPAAQGEQQKDLDAVTEFLFQLSDSNLTGNLFMASESFCEASCETIGDPQISLFDVQNHQDFCGFLEDEKLSENDSCDSERLVVEFSPLNMPSREGLESNLLGRNRGMIQDNTPEPKSHGYRPRPTHYLSRILQR